jgi:hypothetical protein
MEWSGVEWSGARWAERKGGGGTNRMEMKVAAGQIQIKKVRAMIDSGGWF